MSPSGLMARLAGRSAKHRIPVRAHFDLTYRCNERCVHCYLDHQDQGELATAEVRRILDQLKQAGVFFLSLSGGEIFLRDDIFELLAHARSLHFDVNIKTNGTLIDSAAAARLKKLGVRLVQISLYSPTPEVHDGITLVHGSWGRSLAAIRVLKDEGLTVKLACPLMPQNLGDYRRIAALASQLQVTFELDLTITPSMKGDMGPLALRASAQQLLPVLADPLLKPQCYGRQSDPRGMAEAYREIPCSAGHNSCYISPYGDVYPCVQLPLPCGNLRRQNFAEIWFAPGKMLQVAAVRENSVPVCCECGIRQYCERCPGLAAVEDGSFNGPSARACELAEARASMAGVAPAISAFHKPATRD